MTAGESAFWQFSLRFYRRPQVPALCLQLQDEYGVDVNLLFLLNFFAMQGRQLGIDEVRRIDASVSDWRRRIVQPLRAIRRELKGGTAPIDAQSAAALRSAIKRDELQAERLQQEALEREFPLATTGTPAAPRAAAAANIAAYRAALGGLPAAAFDTLLAALVEELAEEFHGEFNPA